MSSPHSPRLTSARSHSSKTTTSRELAQELYPKIFQKDKELAGKITGRILELPEQEIRQLLGSDQKLDAKIKEARQVFQGYVRQKLKERRLPQQEIKRITTEFPLQKMYEIVQNKKFFPPFNMAVNALGVDLVVGFVEQMLAFFPDKALISVGSGGARLEKEIADRHPGRTVVCVDPDPRSYTRELPLLWPQFKTSHEAAASKEGLTDQLLLLDWPYPGNDYDVQALRDLKPVMCVVVTETSGSAGSQHLNNMMYYSSREGYTRITKEEVHQTTLLGHVSFTVGLFARNDIKTIPEIPEYRFLSRRIESLERQLADAKQQLASMIELEIQLASYKSISRERQLADAKLRIESVERQLKDAKQQLALRIESLERQLADAKQQLAVMMNRWDDMQEIQRHIQQQQQKRIGRQIQQKMKQYAKQDKPQHIIFQDAMQDAMQDFQKETDQFYQKYQKAMAAKKKEDDEADQRAYYGGF